jgi:cytochrome P450
MSILNDLWSKALQIDEDFSEDFEVIKHAIENNFEAIAGKPPLIEPLIEYLQNNHPVILIRDLAIVTSYADLVEVLDKQDPFFSTAEIYAQRMTDTGLGIDIHGTDSPDYDYVRLRFAKAYRPPGDFEKIQQFAEDMAEKLIQNALPKGNIDVVSEFVHPFLVAFFNDYFGLELDEETLINLIDWTRHLYRHIFFNQMNDENIKSNAAEAGGAIRAYLEALMAKRKQEMQEGKTLSDNFLNRLLIMQNDPANVLEDKYIIANVGLTTVAIQSSSIAISQAINNLFNFSDKLKQTHQAALAGDSATVNAYMMEALRFDPQDTFLFRACKEDFIVAKGTPRETLIPKGTKVLLGILFGMFDPAKVINPEQFIINRPEEIYMVFGHGQHQCFGEQIAKIMMPILAKKLFRLNNLRRADGSSGTLSYNGAFPTSMVVEFDV